MKTVLYWFSGTGNSLAVAKAIQRSMDDCELIPASRAVLNPPPAAERIGLVFPVYGGGPPRMIARLAGVLQAAPGAYIFAVATCAALSGDALMILRRLLQQRGLDLAAGWTVKMPENYPPMGGAPPPARQQEINARAAEQTERVIAELKTSPRGRYEKSFLLWKLAARLAYPVFIRTLPRAGRRFRADEKCNGCGICANICPADNIVMKDGRPQWLGRCEQCFACLHWCPQEAVQFFRSRNQPRYHHPDATLHDLVRGGR